MEPIKISESKSRKICYGDDPDFEQVVEQTQKTYTANGGRWLMIFKRLSDGALFAVQRESENENEGYGEELIPIECTTVLVAHRVWHRPGEFKWPSQTDDATALVSTLNGLL